MHYCCEECCRGWCCYPCYKQKEILHELTISVPNILDLTLIKFCNDMFEDDCHDCHNCYDH